MLIRDSSPSEKFRNVSQDLSVSLFLSVEIPVYIIYKDIQTSNFGRPGTMNSPQQGSHETRTIEAPGDPRTWPLSISIKYVHSSHKSLHPFKSILLAQSHPLQRYRGIIRSLLPFTRRATIYCIYTRCNT